MLKKKPIVRLFVSNIAKFGPKVNVQSGMVDAGHGSRDPVGLTVCAGECYIYWLKLFQK
jgi:hypothetical protein